MFDRVTDEKGMYQCAAKRKARQRGQGYTKHQEQ